VRGIKKNKTQVSDQNMAHSTEVTPKLIWGSVNHFGSGMLEAAHALQAQNLISSN